MMVDHGVEGVISAKQIACLCWVFNKASMCVMMVDGQTQSGRPSYQDDDSFYVLPIRTLTHYFQFDWLVWFNDFLSALKCGSKQDCTFVHTDYETALFVCRRVRQALIDTVKKLDNELKEARLKEAHSKKQVL